MPAAIIADQPEPQARLFFSRSSTESSLRLSSTTSTVKAQSPKFGVFGRQRNHSDASSQKMLISAPTHFRHLTSGSQHAFPARPPNMNMDTQEARHIPQARDVSRGSRQAALARDWEPESRHESLPPLEPLQLNIYTGRSRLSPLVPQFELPYMMNASPPPAYAREEAERSHALRSQRSMPSLSRGPSCSPGVSDGNSTPESFPCTTATSKQTARSRSHTSPDIVAIRARVANAMQEVERLQKKIDDVVERQSLYMPSRPSSAHSPNSAGRTVHDLEPMPSIPALPPSAPSFAERLHGEADGLPTAPATVRQSWTTTHEKAGSRRRRPPPPLHCHDNADTVLPPLPLVLRPPLRKKKPFRESLSGFVFPVPARKSSLDSVTNKPRPVKETEGFYQYVPVNGAHLSYESLHSLSSSNGGDENGGEEDAPSPYSPATPRELPMERCATFGKAASGLPLSVGIAL